MKFELGDYPDPEEPSNKMSWTKVEADQIDGSKGYSYFRLREDAAKAYNALRYEVLSLGGVITSAGAKDHYPIVRRWRAGRPSPSIILDLRSTWRSILA